MKFTAVCMLTAWLSAPVLHGETITVTITGTTGEIRVGEGPIFGHKSYTSIPPGDPFVLTYVFDEAKGEQTILRLSDELITQSQIESTEFSSPGVSATLQIGTEAWEFGSSKQSKVALDTSATGKSEQIDFITSAGGNRVTARIVPGRGAFWPKSGDWRSSFTSGPLDGSSASFAADNDRVSAKGSLAPAAIEVSGVDLDGQWLRSNLGGDHRTWQLAHASPRGGYVVEEVNLHVAGTTPDGAPIAPSEVRYWQAWKVAAGAAAPLREAGGSANALVGSGEVALTGVARFYEGLTLPSTFASGNSAYAGGRLSSTSDPHLSTRNATLPVETHTQLPLSSKQPLPAGKP